MVTIVGNTFIGDENNNNFAGPENNQYGIGGDDSLWGNTSNKPYYLYGGNGADQLIGNNYGDELYGGRNSDLLYGDYGNDYLNGGSGSDFFAFDTTLNKNQNVDFIADFVSGTDEVWLSRSIFNGVGNANTFLKSGKFEIGSDATGSKTRILYNQKKGALFYTPDGDSGSKTKFAEVTKGTPIAYDDFYIIA